MLALARQRTASSGGHLLQLVRNFTLGYEAFGEDAASNLKVVVVATRKGCVLACCKAQALLA